MSEHRFHPLTRVCIGCDRRACDLADPPRAKGEHQSTADARVPVECPGIYVAVDGKWVVVTPDQRLIVFDRGTVQEFTQNEMIAVRDAIEQSVR